MTATVEILYLANARIPSEKAHVYQILQMCDAFAAVGAAVRLVYPRRANLDDLSEVTDLAGFYGVKRLPDMVARPCLDAVKLVTIDFPTLARTPLAAVAFAVQAATFAGMAAPLARQAAHAGWIVYSRDWPALWPVVAATRRPRRAVWEAHDLPQSRIARAALRRLLPRLAGVVAITAGLAQELTAWAGPDVPVLVAPDGVDLDRFAATPSLGEARKRLGWSAGSQIVVYAGHLYSWKGVYTLAQAAALLAPTIQVVIVGGTPADRQVFAAFLHREGLTARVRLIGYVPPGEVPTYLAAADVLALPNSGALPISRTYTSPLKLFEYMAARRPIVASNLPALREVLTHDQTACLVPADSPSALAQSLTALLADPDRQQRLATAAAVAVRQHTWRARAQRIIEWLDSRQ